MEQKYVLGIVALAMIAILGVSAVSAFGFGKGLMNPIMTDEEKSAMQEKQQAMQTAIKNKDYASWKSLMEERIAKMQSELTEENFNKIVEMHEKMSKFQDKMKEARDKFCQENDCPIDGEIGSKGSRGNFGMMKRAQAVDSE